MKYKSVIISRIGAPNKLTEAAGFILLFIWNLIPGGKRSTFYGITLLYRKNPKPFREDLPKLFQLLADQKIKPVIAEILPLPEAARAMKFWKKVAFRVNWYCNARLNTIVTNIS
ncbi:hypothetical protein JW960_05950 [candidate division KSB1 bacterium]|nr:hypothetical protein [candidate division KSB1 bacterium]